MLKHAGLGRQWWLDLIHKRQHRLETVAKDLFPLCQVFYITLRGPVFKTALGRGAFGGSTFHVHEQIRPGFAVNDEVEAFEFRVFEDL